MRINSLLLHDESFQQFLCIPQSTAYEKKKESLVISSQTLLKPLVGLTLIHCKQEQFPHLSLFLWGENPKPFPKKLPIKWYVKLGLFLLLLLLLLLLTAQVVLAASIVTKQGKAILSRQFVEMTGARIEGLLTSFPNLISAKDQHTFVETDAVRYVYQVRLPISHRAAPGPAVHGLDHK
jgi:hypothetical protein